MNRVTESRGRARGAALLWRPILAFAFLAASVARGQEPGAATEQWEKTYTLAVQDNSFFIEEAFNQEAGVVQHIAVLSFFQRPQREHGHLFTQEWPLGSVKHQLSYEIGHDGAGSEAGFADIVLNYRYQLFDKPDGIAVAPRISVSFPTGDEERGFGAGVPGLEVNIPASRRFSERFVGHANAGIALFPRVKGTDLAGAEVRRTVTSSAFGASMIYLAGPNLNFLIEYVAEFAGELGPDGEVSSATTQLLSPGVRGAVAMGSLQIVPGLAVPFRFRESGSEAGAFLYLSFEHPF